ncbi:MAG: phage portal protein [Desulfovibrionaceae bacterium]
MYTSPLTTARTASRQSRDAGSLRGTMSTWLTQRLTNAEQEQREITLSSRRAEDLYANDGTARSGINDICTNAIGTGLIPQVKLPYKILGISQEQASELQEQMEWAFSLWSSEAHVKGIENFSGLQYCALRSILRNGECFHLPVSVPLVAGRTFSLALQDISPHRVMTPVDKILDPMIRTGIRLSPHGAPVSYFIATPLPSLMPLDYSVNSLTSQYFQERPAKIGHRPNIFHLFRYEDEEQVRGVSALAPSIKLFRNLADCIDYELFAQVIAASFPLFIETESANALEAAKDMYNIGGGNDGTEKQFLQLDLREGGISIGAPGQKPHILESKRPSANFASFTDIVLRAISASLGTSYESLTKDFTKANYSAARAAMNEAWKTYKMYRRWFAARYCQPIFEMVMEEALLRGMFRLPTGLNDFYARQNLWCNVTWVGPARGFVDPVKEIQAVIMSLQNGLMTFEDAWAERGEDFDEGLETMREERKRLSSLAPLTLSAQKTLAPPKHSGLVDDSMETVPTESDADDADEKKDESDA